MTMFKLSEKGLGKLYNSKACYYDPDTEEEAIALSYFEHVFEFEPDDFKGVVVLTVEEADLLFSVIDGFFDLRLPTTKEIVALTKLKVRVERIAKAEMNDVQTIRNLS